MKSLPLPLRVVAGLAATAVERAGKLPEEIAGLPVTVASQALQLSMRVQQHVTELAIKGDEALAGLRSVEEQPDWATFDEDEDEDSTVGATVHDFLRREEPTGSKPDHGSDLEELTAPMPPAPAGSADADAGEGTSIEPDLRKRTPSRPRPTGIRRQPKATEPRSVPTKSTTTQSATAESRATDSRATGSAPGGLTGFDDMSVAQVRGKLRTLSLVQLEELLEYERTHGARERFITMLSNRMRTVRASDR